MILLSPKQGGSASSSITHNDTLGILGSTSYYHLSSSDYAKVGALSSSLTTSFNHEDLSNLLGSSSYYHVSSGVYAALTSGLSTGYLLLDQTTPQTIINGIPLMTATVNGSGAGSQLVNKDYVDLAVSSLELTEFFHDSASDLSPLGGVSTYLMDETEDAAGTVTSAAVPTGAAVNIYNFATASGKPHLDRLVKGVYDCHTHCYRSVSATRTVNLYFELYKYETDTTQTLLGTSETLECSSTATGGDPMEFHITLSSEVTLDVTDRLILKWYAVVTGAGGANPTVTFDTGGTKDSHFSVKVNATELTSIFVPYTGAESHTDLGSYGITGSTGTFSSGLQANNLVLTSGLTATTGNFSSSVDIGGNLDITSGMTATTGNFSGALKVSSGLTVLSTATFSSNVTMLSNLAITSGITATTGNFSSSVDIAGNLDITSGWTATTGNLSGGLNVSSGLTVGSTATFSSNVTMLSNLAITSGLTATTGNFSSGIEVLAETKTANIQITSAGGVTSGYYLMANDATGNAVWAAVSAGGITYTNITNATSNTTRNNGYIANLATTGVQEFALPSTCSLGSVIKIVGNCAGGWKLTQLTNQQINFGNTATTVSTGGYLQSTNRYDSVGLICTVLDTVFTVTDSIGNILTT